MKKHAEIQRLLIALFLGFWIGSCAAAKESSTEGAIPSSGWDPSSNYPALSGLFSAALGTSVKIKGPGGISNVLADGSNSMAILALDEKGPMAGSPLGRLWLRAPAEGVAGVPVLIQAWFALSRPAVVVSVEAVFLKIPGGQSREALRVRYLPTPDTREEATSDRRWWRFYAVNPGEPRMPLLLDGAWKKDLVPDAERPEAGLVESIQDWRTDSSPDWLLGKWVLSGRSDGGEAMTFLHGAAYRYSTAMGATAFGWYIKPAEQTWFLETGRMGLSTPFESAARAPRRSRISYERGRACFATADGESWVPAGCFAPSP
jgi:hypothetical protein